MTKPQAKKAIKEYYRFEEGSLKEMIVDIYIWKDSSDGEFMFQVITISKNHCPYCHSGYFIGEDIKPLLNGSGLLTLIR